jgi:hypothetical protein
VAEWLGTGLQSRSRGFDSRHSLAMDDVGAGGVVFKTWKVLRAAVPVRKGRPPSDVIVTCVCDQWSARESSHGAAEEALRQHIEYDCPISARRLGVRHYANFEKVKPLDPDVKSRRYGPSSTVVQFGQS